MARAYAMGYCPVCLTPQAVSLHGRLQSHSSMAMGYSLCPGSQQLASSLASKYLACQVCGRMDVKPAGSDLKMPDHLGHDGILCSGSASQLGPVITRARDEVSQEVLDHLAASLAKQAGRTGSILMPQSSLVKGRVSRPKANPVAKAAELKVKEEKAAELCQGGDSPKADCKVCGDTLYMSVTGQDERYLPRSYEGWRDQYVRFGKDWAKERMLDFRQDHHIGVLADDWTPDTQSGKKPPEPELEKVPSVVSFAAVMWLLCMTASLVAFFRSGEDSMYLATAAVYALLTGVTTGKRVTDRGRVIRSNQRKQLRLWLALTRT